MTNLPDTIAAMFEQLGGRKIFAMAFSGSAYSTSPVPELVLNIATALRRGAKGKATTVVVTLDPSDTYTVKTLRVGTARTGYATKTLETCEGIYCDMLRECVEGMTGLALSL